MRIGKEALKDLSLACREFELLLSWMLVRYFLVTQLGNFLRKKKKAYWNAGIVSKWSLANRPVLCWAFFLCSSSLPFMYCSFWTFELSFDVELCIAFWYAFFFFKLTLSQVLLGNTFLAECQSQNPDLMTVSLLCHVNPLCVTVVLQLSGGSPGCTGWWEWPKVECDIVGTIYRLHTGSQL